MPIDVDFKKVYIPWFNKESSKGSFDHRLSMNSIVRNDSNRESTVSKSRSIHNSLPCNSKSVCVRRGQLTRPSTLSSAMLARTMQLPWVIFENSTPGPAVLLITSAMESILKYAEVIHCLVEESGCSVYTMELRCQGFSSRSLEDPGKVHVDSFTEYYNDTLSFIDNVIYPHMDLVGRRREDLSVMGIGIGSLIVTYIATRYQQTFNRAVLISPFLGSNKSAWKQKIATKLKYSFQGKAKQLPTKNKYAHSVVSTARQQIWQQLQREMGFESQPTNKWIDALLKTEFKKSCLASAFECVPVLVLTGGADSFISISHVKEFVHGVPLCNHRHFPDGNHEILFDSDHIRASVMFEATKFLKNDVIQYQRKSLSYGWGEPDSSSTSTLSG